jgi:hypothetical protein
MRIIWGIIWTIIGIWVLIWAVYHVDEVHQILNNIGSFFATAKQ